ncbi:chalcone isomerase family protein [Allohahella sp. A8]|mgnify:CR=1 FL=1|jgi:hypothetical protein|uniref:chalcone isomerase family protein n=1 Tax=Allohahella sp. A8 TaxID=3141461 RepID=UPI000C08E44C|nr:chalcone isomerase [Hahellaceae bacterium]|tara:strand:- start:11476 stop:12051 length:576 start_codon:yes stop_codon:yes gene_type:complete
MNAIKNLIAGAAIALSVSTISQAATVANVEIPDTMEAAGTDLRLNGAGIREKWFFNVYVGGLYLPESMNDGAAIVAADKPMAVKLHMVSGMVTSEKMKDATMEGFESSTGGDMAPLQKEIDQFMSAFDEEIQENDVFDLVYVPGTGIEIYKNEELIQTVKSDKKFKEAVFGIWLSDKPAQEDLKMAMLGKK